MNPFLAVLDAKSLRNIRYFFVSIFDTKRPKATREFVPDHEKCTDSEKKRLVEEQSQNLQLI